MKTGRRFAGFFILIFCVLLFKAGSLGDRMSQVEQFRGAQLETGVFDPMIAGNVNRAGLLHLTVDGQSYDNQGGEIMLNSSMHVMVSLPFIRDVFSASAESYPDGTILVERNDDTLVFKKDSTEGTVNDENVTLEEAPGEFGGKVYIGLSDLSEIFHYGFTWDAPTVTAALDSTNAEAPRLKASYDLRTKGRAPVVRDQSSMSSCWAYAACSALESSLLPEQQLSLSPEDLASRNTYGRGPEEAGNYMIAVSDMTSWQGPVTEEGGSTAVHVQEVHFYSDDDVDDIKWAVFRDGGLSTSIYAEIVSPDLSRSSWYNSRTDAYYYNGQKEPNHDVVIIGWDDNYSRKNFSLDVPGDGAFICQNSWGDDFGDHGVFYVSYYDTNIGSYGVSYAKAESTDNYDRIYQYDLLGMVGTIGYDADSALAANVYTARSDETLRAAGFYTAGKNTAYKVYVVENFTGVESLAGRKAEAEGTIRDRGYYTVPLSDPLSLTEGERFAVVVMFSTPGAVHPVPIEYDGNALTHDAVTVDGEGYISRNGLQWENVEESYDADLCIKAYTDTRAAAEKRKDE